MAQIVRYAPVGGAVAPASTPQEAPRPILAKFESKCRVGGERTYVARQAEVVCELLPAFGAFAQGTSLATASGTKAVEDIDLNEVLLSADGQPLTVIWTGEVILKPTGVETPWLRRIQPERFGFARPMTDLILGRETEVITDPISGTGQRVDRYDGDEMIHSLNPPAPVRLFHVACQQPGVIMANGLAVRSLDTHDYLMGKLDLFRDVFDKMMPTEALPTSRGPWKQDVPHRRIGNG